jgi:cytidylate kinase
MNIITISREFGSGGRELGKRLADQLGYDYYDNEIISAVAKKSGLDENYVENTLDNHGWQNMTLTFRGTLGTSSYVAESSVALLIKQKEVIESIAALGKDCVIVGRNADVILDKYKPFNVFVCASKQAKLMRCVERAPEGEKLTEKQILRKMKQIDNSRAQTRDLMTGSGWGERDAYHLIVNTTDWDIKELVPAVADFASRWFGRLKR